FAAKLDFAIEPGTAHPIQELAPMLRNVPAARMFDEVLKLLMAGSGDATFHLMREFVLFDALIPAAADALDQDPTGEAQSPLALRLIDAHLVAQPLLTPAFIYGALRWPALQREYHRRIAEGVPEQVAMAQAASDVFEQQLSRAAIPPRFSLRFREICEI